MKIIRLTLVLALCNLMLGQAQVPGTLSYQGILMQSDGITPLVDGAHTIVFNFDNISTVDDPALFSRTVSVTTTKGLFTCIIGGGTGANAPFNASEIGQLGSQQIYIGIKVDGGANELSPRAQLTPGAYSFRAETVTNTPNPTGGNVSFWGTNNTLSSDAGLFWDNSNKRLGIGTISPAGPLDIKGSIGNFRAFDYTLQFTRPATNYFHATSAGGQFYFTVNGNADTDASMVIKPSGDVGIGTVSPASRLHIKGNGNLLRLEGTDHSYVEFYPDGPATRKAYIGFGGATENSLRINNEISGGDIVLATTGSGSVGIGTGIPNYTLDVVGDVEFTAGTAVPLRIHEVNELYGIRVYNENDVSFWDLANYNSNNFHFRYNGTSVAYINDSNGSWNASSDLRLKENINGLSDILPKILQLNPKTYNFKRDVSEKKCIGLIAQEVLPLFPETVELESTGYYSMSTSDFGILSIQGIKELHQIIQQQQVSIEELKTELSLMKSMQAELAEIKKLLSNPEAKVSMGKKE